MKKFLYYIFLLIIPVISFAGCSGNDGDEEEESNLITISADKRKIQANGVDAVVLTVKKGNSDITSLSQIVIENENSEITKLNRGANEFTTVKPGKYILSASYYEGETFLSENSIEVEVTETTETKFKHILFAMQFTSVYCTYCPNLSVTLKTLQEDQYYNERLAIASFHKDFNGVDPMTYKYTDTYYNNMGAVGLPSFFLDFNKNAGSNWVVSEVKKAIDNRLKNSPTICGVAIETEYNEETRALSVTSKVISDFDNSKYKIMVFVTEDNIKGRQDGQNELIYYHQNVVRDMLQSGIWGDKLGEVEAGVEKVKKFSYKVPETYVASEMRVIVCILNTLDGGVTYEVVNCNMCELGSSVDYQYKD